MRTTSVLLARSGVKFYELRFFSEKWRMTQDGTLVEEWSRKLDAVRAATAYCRYRHEWLGERNRLALHNKSGAITGFSNGYPERYRV